MIDKSGLRPKAAVGEVLETFAHEILAEAGAAIGNTRHSDAVAVHEYRKAMKRWRALLRLLEPFLGQDCRRWRSEAAEFARTLGSARDAQSALDALADLARHHPDLPKSSLVAIRRRVEALRVAAEATALTDQMRDRLSAAIARTTQALEDWPLNRIGFADLAARLTKTYRQARRAVPDDWSEADATALHRLRQRVVAHRYQMELIEALWPRFIRLWISEAQRLRDRLGAYQNLIVLSDLTAAARPLASWSRPLAPLIAARQAVHVAAAAKLAARLFAERPQAFKNRMEALWDSRRAGR